MATATFCGRTLRRRRRPSVLKSGVAHRQRSLARPIETGAVNVNVSRALCAAAGFAATALLDASVCAQPPAQVATGQSAPQADSPQAVEEIVVRGRRMSEIDSDLRIQVDKFVDEIAAPPMGRGYARWQRHVCISITNLDPKTAQYLVDRIARLALDVGLEPGEPGCRPDVVIAFTTNGKETAGYIVENQPTLLRPYGEGGVQRGLAAMREFAESDKPVRWWHVSLPVDARTGAPAIRVPGEGLDPGKRRVVNVAGPSRLHSGIRDELKYVIIIVDGPKLQGKGTTWQQLGDLLALVSLAQVDLEAHPTTFDSILNLFSNPSAYSGLTDWDLTYVHALYSYDQERNVHMQSNTLVGQMMRQDVDNAE
jgi:hypothetical protein